MTRSRPFGLFILVLCLVACVCAHGDVSINDAKNAVKKAQESTENVLDKVAKEVRDALELQKDIDTQKKNAEAAAAEAEKGASGNKTVEAIAQKARKASDEVVKRHSNAAAAAKSIVDKMNELRAKARGLYGNAKALSVGTDPTTNYTKIKEDADNIKSQADALDNDIKTAEPSFRDARVQKQMMSNFVSDARLAQYHINIIVAIAEFDALLESAENDIKLIEQKRDEIAVIEKAMKKIYDNKPDDLISHISSLYLSVEGALSSASSKIDEAKEAKKDMLKQKEIANTALVNVQAGTDSVKAYQEVGDARRAVKNAAEKLKDTKKALESATIYATNAALRKKSAERALNERAKKQNVTQDNKKTNPPDSENTHQPVKETTESPTVIGTKQPIIINPDQSGSGGTEATQLSSNDSAMTVSLPLLFALIAYVSFH